MKKSILNEFNVKILFVISTIFYCIPYFMVFVDSFMNLLILWAAVVVGWDLANRRDILKTHSALIGILFLSSFVCTIFLNKFSTVNLKLLVYIFLQLCFFTYFDSRKTKEEVINELNKFSSVIIGITFLLNIISLYLFFSGYCEVFTNSVTSMELIVGRHPNSSLYGIMSNSNWTSFLELTSIGLLKLQKKRYGKTKKREKVALYLCIITLFLTNSRGGLIGFLVFSSIESAVSFIYFLKRNRKKAAKCLVFFPILIALILSGNLAVKNISGNIFQYIQSRKVVLDTLDEQQEYSSISKNSSTVERDKSEKEGSNNIRVELWQAGIKVILENFLVGIGGAEIGEHVSAKLCSNTQVDSLALASNTHNIFIQTALTAGIIGVICFCVYISREFLYGLFYLIAGSKNKEIEEITGILLSLLVSYLVINMVEADIFMSRNFMSSLFWIFLGYMTRLVQMTVKDRRKSNEIHIYHTCALE